LVVERHLTRGKRLKDLAYIDFGATCDANMKVWKAKLDQLFDELK
jgi:hypothetical protein